MKINLELYTSKNLSNFISLLNQFENNGITDLTAIRTQVQAKIEADRQEIKQKKSGPLNEKKIKCPECNGAMVRVYNADGLKILGCKNCRFSKLIE